MFSSGFPQVRDGDVSGLSQGRDRDGIGAEKQSLWGNEWGLTGLRVLAGDRVPCRETRVDQQRRPVLVSDSCVTVGWFLGLSEPQFLTTSHHRFWQDWHRHGVWHQFWLFHYCLCDWTSHLFFLGLSPLISKTGGISTSQE